MQREQAALGYLALSHASWLRGNEGTSRAQYSRAASLARGDLLERISRRAPWSRGREEVRDLDFRDARAVAPDEQSEAASSSDDDEVVLCRRSDLRDDHLM